LCLLWFLSIHVVIAVWVHVTAVFCVDRICRAPFTQPVLAFPKEYIDMLKGMCLPVFITTFLCIFPPAFVGPR
jgi:hypothetical protein